MKDFPYNFKEFLAFVFIVVSLCLLIWMSSKPKLADNDVVHIESIGRVVSATVIAGGFGSPSRFQINCEKMTVTTWTDFPVHIGVNAYLITEQNGNASFTEDSLNVKYKVIQ